MAGDDSLIQFILDLDDSGFVSKINSAIDNVSGIAEQMKTLGIIAGSVGAAFLAVKTSIDLIFEAEQIKSLNAQFDLLTQQAGISGDALKDAMEKASGGLLSESELLQVTNRSLIEFGNNADKISQIMDLARRISIQSGVELKTVFDELSQSMASGQTRALRQFGIYVDSTKAVNDYAKANGLASNALSDMGRRMAIANAALDQGNEKYGQITGSAREATDAWTRFKNAITDTKDSISLIFDRLLGPAITKAIQGFAELAKDIKLSLQVAMGDSNTSARAELQQTERQIQTLKEKIDDINNGRGMSFVRGTSLDELNQAESQLTALESKMKTLQASQKSASSPGSGASVDGSNENDKSNKLQLIQNENTFQKEILALKQEALQTQEQLARTGAQADQAVDSEKLLAQEQAAQKVKDIQSSHSLNEQQKADEIVQINENLKLKLDEIESQREAKHKQVEQQMMDDSKSSANTIAAGMKKASLDAARDATNSAKLGSMAFTKMTDAVGSGFVAMGQSAKLGGDEMRGFMFGALADIAEAQGRLLLASVLVNPLNAVAGAALLVLSGVLRAQANSSSSAGLGGGGGGSGGGEIGGTSTSLSNTLEAQQQKKQSVSIQIMGSYYETEQTKQRLVDLIREHADVTDFKVTS